MKQSILWLTLGLLWAIPSCAPLPPYQKLARQHSLHGYTIHTSEFTHRVYSNTSLPEVPPKRLHIYIEGDGTTWQKGAMAARDPTPHRVLMMELMLKDPHPSLFLGRPCYFHTEDDNCHPFWWTQGRYHNKIVASMKQALADVIGPNTQVCLFGHSGGGTLADLLARRLPQTHCLVTLAANLDTGAWSEYHDYHNALDYSLDPAQRNPLPETITAWHLLGRRDHNVPPYLIAPLTRKRPREQFCLVKAGHTEGWADVWPHMLTLTQRASSTTPPPQCPAPATSLREVPIQQLY